MSEAAATLPDATLASCEPAPTPRSEASPASPPSRQPGLKPRQPRRHSDSSGRSHRRLRPGRALPSAGRSPRRRLSRSSLPAVAHAMLSPCSGRHRSSSEGRYQCRTTTQCRASEPRAALPCFHPGAPPLSQHSTPHRPYPLSSASAQAMARRAWLWPLGCMQAVSPLCQWAASCCAHGPLPQGSSGPCALCKLSVPVLSHWATGGFSPLAFYLFCYFLNMFKFFQSSKICLGFI
jgi:hypothetical protein